MECGWARRLVSEDLQPEGSEIDDLNIIKGRMLMMTTSGWIWLHINRFYNLYDVHTPTTRILRKHMKVMGC